MISDSSSEEKRIKVMEALDEFLDSAYFQVQESESRLKAIMEASPTGMVMIDQNGIIKFINPTLVEFFGYSEEELIGQKVEILLPESIRPGHPDQRNSFFQSPEKRAMGGNRNLEGRRKDGSTFSVEIGLNPVKQGDGIFALATITDITERVKNIKVLTETNEKLEKTNEELENFAYRSTHDLKAPLAAITSLCELAKLNVKDEKYNDLTGILEHIGTSSQRLSNLVTDILDLSRANFKKESKEEINLEDLMVLVKENLSYYLDQSSVELNEDYKHTTEFYSEKTRIKQILENLVSNAIKYSDPKKESQVVKIRSYQLDSNLVIEVEDNGLGVAKEDTEKIFTMFYRAHKDIENSSGLGLYIVKRHVEKLQGIISCSSKEGEGSCFQVILPIVKGA